MREKNQEQIRKRHLVLAIVLLLFLVIIMIGRDFLEGKKAVEQGILRGKTQDDIYQEEFILETESGTKQDVTVTVYPRMLSEDELSEMFDQAILEFEDQYLGENTSADNVSADMIFPNSLCDGMVSASYDSSCPNLLWEDGTVSQEYLTEEGQLVTVTAAFICQEQQMEYSFAVCLVSPVLSEQEKKQQAIADDLSLQEEVQRDEARFFLPNQVAGENVDWKKKMSPEPLLFLLLGCAAIFCMMQKGRQEQRQKKKQREMELLKDYPQMVAQLSMLMGAGMTLNAAWERMTERYLAELNSVAEDKKRKKKWYLEEMLFTYRQIKDGGHIRREYEAFGNRIGLSSYRKFASLLLQNLDKGTKDIVRLLDVEAEMALEEQKHRVRKQGEEAGTKLLFPMILLFVMILMIIMIPALKNF